MPTRRSDRNVRRGAWLPCTTTVGIGSTTSLWPDRRVVEPLAFLAVTATRSVPFTSASCTPYVLPVAPATGVHSAPKRSHCSHWYVTLVGEFVHVPGSAVSVLPTIASPVIDGRVVAIGTPVEGTTLVRAELAVDLPSALPAPTTARRRLPPSAARTTYVCPTSPLMSVHDDVLELVHLCH